MVLPNVTPLLGKVLVVVLLLGTPAIAFPLIASTATGDAGPLDWLLLVVLPLALLGSGIFAIARGAWDEGPRETGSDLS